MAFLLSLVLASAVLAREYSPRVLSPHNADTYSLKTFADFERWRDLEGDAKAWAVFQYLTDPRTGLYPMGAGAFEGQEGIYEFSLVRDPVKLLNIYPQSYCDVLGPAMAGIAEGMGLGPARTVNIPGWGHVASEVFYGGRWHYLDLDVRAAFRREDGTLASIEDARKDPGLWRGPSGPRFFPKDRLEEVQKVYRNSRLEFRHGVAAGGHTMDYVLRRGETFIRWWKPQGDRWSDHPSYHQELAAVLEREPRGPKSKHPDFTIHTHGNGLFVYRPRLAAGSPDFEDGAYDSKNVSLTAAGLTLDASGDGFAVFEVRSPYCIVPRVGKYETTDDDREASVVKVDGAGTTLELSLDGGLTWKGIAAPAGVADLTPLVSGGYGYLLRIVLRGEPGQAVVRSLEIATWVQVHPASLPSLRIGKNRMRYVTGDHYGLQTRVVEIRTNGGDREDFLKHLAEPPADFDPARKTERLKGTCRVKVEPPPGATIAWFSAGGSFNTHQGEAAARTRNSIAYAIDESKDFKTIYTARIPTDQSHWHYNADMEVKLAEPARRIMLRYVGDPGLNDIRIYAHCLDGKRPARSPVRITHRWSEGGEPRTQSATLNGPGEYEIECRAEPVDESVEIEVP